VTDGEDFPCEECARSFASSRARTQHARFVHEGARLFGYRLATEGDSEPDEDADIATGASPLEVPSGELDPDAEEEEGPFSDWALLVGAAVVVGALLLATQQASASVSIPPSPSPFPIYREYLQPVRG
jgi:hypothetical protein